MDANFTADPRFQAWSEAAHRSMASNLDAALTCGRLTEIEERAIITGAAYALAEVIIAREKGATSLQDRAERAAQVWANLGAGVFVQLAAGLTPPSRS